MASRGGKFIGRRRVVVALASFGFALSLAAVALAAPGSLEFQEIDQDPVSGGTVDGLDGATGVAVSPDGNSVYAASSVDDAVVAFDRVSGGGLELIEAERDVAAGGSAEGLDGAEAVAVSPDGLNIYVGSNGDDALVVFRRKSNGSIVRISEERSTTTGGEIDTGLHSPTDVQVSGDGANVYVSDQNDNSVLVFRRDPLNGKLKPIDLERDVPNGVAEGLGTARALAVAPDGDNVYAVASGDHALVTFRRNLTSGKLKPIDTLTDDEVAGTVSGLEGAFGVAIRPDGASLYTAAFDDDAVVAFRRKDSGKLVEIDSEVDAESGGSAEGLDGANSVTVAPDSITVYATSFSDDAVVTIRRDDPVGNISFVESDMGPTVDGLDGAQEATVSPGLGKDVYVVSLGDDAITTFDRNVPSGP